MYHVIFFRVYSFTAWRAWTLGVILIIFSVLFTLLMLYRCTYYKFVKKTLKISSYFNFYSISISQFNGLYNLKHMIITFEQNKFRCYINFKNFILVYSKKKKNVCLIYFVQNIFRKILIKIIIVAQNIFMVFRRKNLFLTFFFFLWNVI